MASRLWLKLGLPVVVLLAGAAIFAGSGAIDGQDSTAVDTSDVSLATANVAVPAVIADPIPGPIAAKSASLTDRPARSKPKAHKDLSARDLDNLATEGLLAGGSVDINFLGAAAMPMEQEELSEATNPEPEAAPPESTTIPPTTIPPTTIPPTTIPPTTIPPTTIPPTTVAPTTIPPTTVAPTNTAAPAPGDRVEAVIAEAHRQLGVRYVWAGSTPATGFDCSGFTSWVWAAARVQLPHQSGMQKAATMPLTRDQLQPGDLVFYGSPINHVGLYIGDNQLIHAPRTGKTVELKDMDYSSKAQSYGRVN